ncbi:MAG TPA: hypothetical protein VHG71_13145 [Verrucomicrobiae bacterium]|nr:hypothetical protein [Verrucomicrobiae bacterium]
MLILGVGCLIALRGNYWPASFVVAFAVGHFFLFCNVFRISRRLELVWTGIFVVLTGGTVLVQFPGWPATFAVSICATVVVIAVEMKKPSYHGIFWKQINPRLRDWWNSSLLQNELH